VPQPPLVAERLAELTAKSAALASSPQTPASLGRVEAALRRLPVHPGLRCRRELNFPLKLGTKQLSEIQIRFGFTGGLNE
jgi:hypothetical protein